MRDNIKYKQKKETQKLRNLTDEAYRKYVYCISMDLLKDPEKAEECVQMSFERILAQEAKLSVMNELQLRSYIYRIVKSATVDMYRKKTRDVLMEPSALDILMNEKQANELLASAAWSDDFVQVLDELDEIETEILLQKYIDGKTYREIGEWLGISEEACKKRGQRLKKKVAAKWETRNRKAVCGEKKGR